MINLVGYIALALNLVSMTMGDLMTLRIISFFANGIYIVYGILINAPPIIIGCGIALLIHVFHIIKMRKQKEQYKIN